MCVCVCVQDRYLVLFTKRVTFGCIYCKWFYGRFSFDNRVKHSVHRIHFQSEFFNVNIEDLTTLTTLTSFSKY